MAERELSILVKAKGALQAAQDIGKVDGAVGRLSSTAARGVRTAGANIAKIGVVAGAGIVLGAKAGIQSLAELEDAEASVTGAIKNAGLAGQITAGRVSAWANEIEHDVGAAFDDKAIVAAAGELIRFGKVTPENLRPALVVMTDLATKTGDVDSASSLLAKAMADPAKAAGKLARVGVVLTKSQQDQIKAFDKAGDKVSAQRVLLDALSETTRGAAEASQGPYRRSLSVLADVTEDAQRALGEGFLPVIQKVSDLLSKELAKPETIQNIRDFGTMLAGGLDSLIGIAKNLPWAAIGESLKIGGAGAKAVLDAFVALPPWIQTAVLTGWGLNKLTGGALGSIVGQLASGLIKGVLGIQAGVVNVTGGVVNGVPGGPGVPLGPPSPGAPRNVPGSGGGLFDWLKGVLPRAAGTGVAINQTQPGSAIGSLRDQFNARLAPKDSPAQLEAKRILADISAKTHRDGEIGRTQSAKVDRTNSLLEQIRLQRQTPPIVNVTVPVTLRSVAQRTAVVSKHGAVIS